MGKFRVVGWINAYDKDVDVDSLGNWECLEIMDGKERIGYLCRVGNKVLPFGSDEIETEE